MLVKLLHPALSNVRFHPHISLSWMELVNLTSDFAGLYRLETCEHCRVTWYATEVKASMALYNDFLGYLLGNPGMINF